jgi:polyisoprenyl-teichoic acid--peptidoglycan teichoic acid transferase
MNLFTKANKKLKIFLIILISVILLLSIFFVGSIIFVKSKLAQIQTVDISKEPSELGIDTNKFKPSDETGNKDDIVPSTDITNILLLGTDSRDPESASGGGSDTIIILTLDKAHNKLKLTSILRDSFVTIDGRGEQKLTHAHAYGGALLTLKTLNKNYDLNIMDYVQINFFGFEKVIDYLGGVPIDITTDEIRVANIYIKQMSKIEKKTPTLITSPGLQTLNGIQAVAYARIRYVGNADFKRTERQRTLLSALFNKLAKTNPIDMPAMLDIITPYIVTSLKPDTILNNATYILLHKMTTLEQQRVPYDGLYKNAVVDGRDVLLWDKEPTIERLHKFIFETGD